MERSEEWTLSPDWRLQISGNVVARDGRVQFARRARGGDIIVGRFENYKFQGLLEATCQVYYFDRLGVTVFYCSAPDLIPKEWRDLDEGSDFAIQVKLGDKYYDLVDEEAVDLKIIKGCFWLIIRTPLRAIRRLSFKLDRSAQF